MPDIICPLATFEQPNYFFLVSATPIDFSIPTWIQLGSQPKYEVLAKTARLVPITDMEAEFDHPAARPQYDELIPPETRSHVFCYRITACKSRLWHARF